MSASSKTIAKPALLKQFQVAAGTVPGRRHLGSGNLIAGNNNQDAYCLSFADDAIIAAVFDGCGSAQSSEVGARLAASLVPKAIRTLLAQGLAPATDQFWESATARILQSIRLITAVATQELMPVNLPIDSATEAGTFIRSHFLFTVLGVLITDSVTVIFSCGDGAYQINRELINLGPFEENAPPYPAYGLLAKNSARLTIRAVKKTNELDEVMLATDGIFDLINCEHRRIPGKTRQVGHLDRIWTVDPVFQDIESVIAAPHYAASLTGWLRQLNSEVVKLHDDASLDTHLIREPGLLPDDTTLVALRRTRKEADNG